jgi:hypothetical protein
MTCDITFFLQFFKKVLQFQSEWDMFYMYRNSAVGESIHD